MNRILRCDWLPERARWSYLALSDHPGVSRKKNLSHIINPLLTKACSVKMAGYRPRFFFSSLSTSTTSWSINARKKNLTSHLVRLPIIKIIKRYTHGEVWMKNKSIFSLRNVVCPSENPTSKIYPNEWDKSVCRRLRTCFPHLRFSTWRLQNLDFRLKRRNVWQMKWIGQKHQNLCRRKLRNYQLREKHLPKQPEHNRKMFPNEIQRQKMVAWMLCRISKGAILLNEERSWCECKASASGEVGRPKCFFKFAFDGEKLTIAKVPVLTNLMVCLWLA